MLRKMYACDQRVDGSDLLKPISRSHDRRIIANAYAYPRRYCTVTQRIGNAIDQREFTHAAAPDEH
jgi:hypothetical protein